MTFNKQLLRICLTLLMLASSLAPAKTLTSGDKRPIMLELYTSQGCSSCPPAETWLNAFTDLSSVTPPILDNKILWQDIIPINFHVDYWDYLGWKDPFSHQKFSHRQRRYAQLNFAKNVATPGFIIDGKGWNGWFRNQALPLKQQSSPGQLKVTIRDTDIMVGYSSNNRAHKKLIAHLAILGFDQKTEIIKGENRGHELNHNFVVIGHTAKRLTKELMTYQKTLTLPEIKRFNSPVKGIVVWVTEANDPRPVQVVADWL